jgi:hypothetical protein
LPIHIGGKGEATPSRRRALLARHLRFRLPHVCVRPGLVHFEQHLAGGVQSVGRQALPIDYVNNRNC